MQILALSLLVALLHVSNAQNTEDDSEDWRLHKHKKRRPYQQGYQRPCNDGFGRSEASPVDGDGRSLKVLAALGGAAVGYKLGQAHQNHQQPVINNNIYNGIGGGGGAPCVVGFPAPQPGYGSGSLLSSHPLLASAVGASRNGGVNWDRTVRQFERNVVRPLTRWW